MSVVLQNINLRLILRLISTIVINRKSQKMLRNPPELSLRNCYLCSNVLAIVVNLFTGKVVMDTTHFESLDYESKKRSGRNTKLSEELIQEMCDLIAEGRTFADAARIRRVGESTFYRWLAEGRKENGKRLCKLLVERVQEASDFSEAEALHSLKMSAVKNSNWRSAAWLLERRFPEKYGRSLKCSHDLKTQKESETNSDS